jgi:3-oxoadipyl-CoA thiolase
MSSSAYICDYVRTPFGKYGGALSSIRTDDLGAIPLKALIARNPQVDWDAVDDVLMGCANQAGEDNRNVARMSLLLAGLSVGVPGLTVNRLCGSGLQAIGSAAQMIRAGEANFIVAAGVESMSRAPFVVPKSSGAFSRSATIEDTTIGWRLVNPLMASMYGAESMPTTAENVAERFLITRQDQDHFALRSQEKAIRAIQAGMIKHEICPTEVLDKKGNSSFVIDDEHPRCTSLEILGKLKGVVKKEGTVTAGNSSGVNDGAAAMIVANAEAINQHGLNPRARIVSMAVAGVEPSVMGIGPLPASKKALALANLTVDQLDVVELNEAFAAQALAVLRGLDIGHDDERVNPYGGAIAFGHPLGASGVRIAGSAMNYLQAINGRYGLITMCIGVGQGIALVIEKV